ncbi:MAG: GWxTD domain-containing protein [Bacteroidota bacterium]
MFLVLIPSVLFAQRDFRLPAGREPVIRYEPINLISEDTAKSRLDINFRISRDYFIFTRNRSEAFPWPFIARVDVTVEVFDKTNTSVAREILRKEIGSQEPPSISAKKDFLQGIFSFELPPGDYRLYFEINDLQSSRKFIERAKKITLRNFKDVRLETSDVSFLEPLEVEDGRPRRFLPLNLGGDVFFGRNFDGYIEFTGTDLVRGLPMIQYHLRFYNPGKRQNVTIVQDTVSRDHILVGTRLEIERSEASYLYRLDSSSLTRKYIALLKIDGERLERGRYNLEIVVRSAREEKTIRRSFDVRWIDMPLSLRNIDFAVSAMRHLIGNEADKWRSMREEEKVKTFNGYWKAKDETPETAYNEVQEEYFRRADYAYLNFSSLRQPNGIQTDRGKIYMLYGPPTKTERRLAPKRRPQEFWYYQAIAKLFIFEDSSRIGDYQLIKSEPL